VTDGFKHRSPPAGRAKFDLRKWLPQHDDEPDNTMIRFATSLPDDDRPSTMLCQEFLG
jgi:hypothetical protein